MVMTPEFKIQEFVKCAEDPIYFIENYLKIPVKNGNITKISPFNLMPHQKKIINNYLLGDNQIVSKYRQAGITTLTTAFCTWRTCFSENFKIAVVADKLKTAINEILKKIIDFIKGLPDFLRPKIDGKDKQDHKIYDNGCEIMALAAGKDGTRGYSPNLIFLDEAAFFEWGEEFYTAVTPSLAAGGSMIINSTPNGQDKLYYPVYEEARNKRNSFILNEIFWYEDPRYAEDLVWVKDDIRLSNVALEDYSKLKRDGYKPSSSWYRKMCIELKNDPKKIGQELDNDFNASAGLFIQETILRNHEDKFIVEPIRTEFRGDVFVYEDPIPNQRYIIGCDVSQNVSKGDYSTIVVLKVVESGYYTCLEYQSKISPDELGVILFEIARRYDAFVVVDNTGGQGYSTLSKLFDCGYDRTKVYHSKSMNRAMKDGMKDIATINSDEELYPGFNITTSNRNFIINKFEEVIRLEEFPIYSTRLISELRTFVVKENGKTEHKKGSHDDLIFAYAIAIYCVSTDFNKLTVTNEEIISFIDIFESVNNTPIHQKNRDNKYDWVFTDFVKRY